jgi:3-ketosteroid 9alpha-monooxygenase subunit B
MQLHDAEAHRGEPQQMSDEQQVPDELVVRLNGSTHRLDYRRGETLLETMRRCGLPAPFACLQGACATCIVRRLKGEVGLLENHVLTERDLADGYTLACQGIPTSTECEIELEG